MELGLARPEFRPSGPGPGRLVRLGVVLDPRNPPERMRMIARMCELAGIDALWVRDRLIDPAEAVVDVWTALTLAATETHQTRLGAMLDHQPRGWNALDRLLDLLPSTAMRGRLEVTLCGDAGDTTSLGEAARWLRDAAPAAPIVGVEVDHPGDVHVAARLADDVLLPKAQDPDLSTRVAALATACAAAGRQPASLGVAVQVPVSIGRTATEAQARAAAETLFAGDSHPATSGIFGTLEMCQDRVIELAHAGVTDLRCVLPNSLDVHDVIAQLTAMVIGSVDVLQPGAPRSKPPDAPSAWGGRPRFPSA